MQINFNTDLADERRELYRKANHLENEIEGIQSEEKEEENIKKTKVKVLNEKGAEAIGKPIGEYITIDFKNLRIAEENDIVKAAESLKNSLKELLNQHVKNDGEVLVVGLGNIDITPDALGPKVIKKIEITRHFFKYAPQYLRENARSICAISPGVLGTTGIETVEIIQGIVEHIKPQLLIVIDSLASKSIERINSTIQIADTGISPGAGVDNKRKELNKETLGIPVIAIGIPTVVEAATIVSDSLNLFIHKKKESLEKNEFGRKYNTQLNHFYELIKETEEQDKYAILKEVLTEEKMNLIVTPKEIDDLIDNMSNILARGINLSL